MSSGQANTKQGGGGVNAVETVQSLVVAFVLAMMFRGFVTEGFVIPTGSMAPTLLGAHARARGNESGYEYAVDGGDQPALPGRLNERLADPAASPEEKGTASVVGNDRPRMGDRILVLKSMYPFFEPKRFDVVVFKNPTNPVGGESNFIKRLIGLPNEQVWLADGDVFVKKAGGAEFEVQRKPEHVQRAVWQPVWDSDYLSTAGASPWLGMEEVKVRRRGMDVDPAGGELTVEWNGRGERPLRDYTAYNQSPRDHAEGRFPVADLRVSGSLRWESGSGVMSVEIGSREHEFKMTVGGGIAEVKMRDEQVAADEANAWVGKRENVKLEAGRTVNVEFWHVDQRMAIYIDGREAVRFDYNWPAERRLQEATKQRGLEEVEMLVDAAMNQRIQATELRMKFSGSAMHVERLRVDRDLYYQPAVLASERQNAPVISGPGFGTHPEENAAVLGADQFMMLGDNSPRSADSRVWGRPHPLVAWQVDETPFVVNRELLIGKAWVVYFPAPQSVSEGGTPFVPDFGRMRFIR